VLSDFIGHLTFQTGKVLVTIDLLSIAFHFEHRPL